MSRSKQLPAYPSPQLIECPYGFFEEAREHAPVHRSRVRDEYLVFRHEDIKRVLRETEVFGERLPGGSAFDRGESTMISMVRGEEHRRMRSLAVRRLTPGYLRTYEPTVHQIVDSLIDAFVERGECELMRELALKLPAILTCFMMDLSTEGDEGRLILGHWGDLVEGGDGTAASDHRRPLDRLLDFFEGKLRARAADRSGDDLLTDLVVGMESRDGSLDFDNLTVIATELLVGGAGTTALLIVNATWLLLSNPEQLAHVQANRSLLPWALEEALRTEAVVQERERVALVDTELGGVEIPAGSRLRLVFAAGSRDPEVFECPEQFDVSRSPRKLKEHFGFGYGVHFCAGAPLARIEARIALEHLFDRLPGLRLADRNTYEHVESSHFRAFKELWLEWDRPG
jgi:cytochrome P450